MTIPIFALILMFIAAVITVLAGLIDSEWSLAWLVFAFCLIIGGWVVLL